MCTCLLVALGGCSEPAVLWVEDAPFSEALTSIAPTYQKINGVSASEYVDVVVIYRLNEEDSPHPNLSTLRGKAPVFESRDRGTVRQLLEAAASKVDGPKSCLSQSGDTDTQYYVAAFDRGLMRVGSFRSRICEVKGEQFATVQPTGGAAIYLSRELADVLDAVAPVLAVK